MEQSSPDAPHLEQILGAPEGAASAAVVADASGEPPTHARKGGQLSDAGAVDVHRQAEGDDGGGDHSAALAGGGGRVVEAISGAQGTRRMAPKAGPRHPGPAQAGGGSLVQTHQRRLGLAHLHPATAGPGPGSRVWVAVWGVGQELGGQPKQHRTQEPEGVTVVHIQVIG